MSKVTDHRQRLILSCAHEAGHAVAFRRAGLKVSRVVVGTHRSYTDINDPRPDQLNAYLVGIYAGTVAGARLLVRHFDYSSGAAWSHASVGSDSDWRRLRTERTPDCWSDSKLRSRAESLVRSDWGRIERLALRLADHRRLSGWSL